MPDVPADIDAILPAAAARAGVVARRMEALRADLADAASVPNMDAATQQQGVDLLAAVVAALTALETSVPADGADGNDAGAGADGGVPAAGEPGEADEKHDHGRS